jgi:hypothetical protein
MAVAKYIQVVARHIQVVARHTQVVAYQVHLDYMDHRMAN